MKTFKSYLLIRNSIDLEFFIKIYNKIGYHNKFDRIALSYMKDCKNILDIGCGIGGFISKDPIRIIGIDHNKESLKICEKKGFNVKFGEVTDLPFKDNSFDAVHCSQVIEHLLPEDALKLLNEMNRVLKKEGIFCIRTPLLHKNFYMDFTHIKPYYPEAILHYIPVKKEYLNQRTLNKINCEYKILKLKYLNDQLFAYLNYSEKLYKKIIWGFFNILRKFGIRSLKRTEYIMILKKLK